MVMTGATFVVKIEKIKKNYDEYAMSFTTQVCGLPAKVPIEQRRLKAGLMLAAVNEEEPHAAAADQEAWRGGGDDDSYVSANSAARTEVVRPERARPQS